jgi:nitrite reductase/ring-hydroxylating ferredoxin subunit
VIAGAGYLGGHLSYTRGVGPNQTAFDPGPDDWTAAIDAGDLVADEPRSVVVDETPVLLFRHRDHVHALHDRCSHRGCSLADGEIEGESVVCACHGSRFSLRDGSVERGPATVGQPVFDVRESEGKLEVKRR